MTLEGNTVFSSVRYEDASAALEWLARVFGFTASLVIRGPGDTIAHAELWLGDGVLQVGSHQTDREGRPAITSGPALTYLRVEDVEAAADRAQSTGAAIVQPVLDGPSGLNFIAMDPEGNLWAVGNYSPTAPTKTSGLPGSENQQPIHKKAEKP
jgi:uncharacterized glyoxalase superfamily protein PhnB